MLSQNLCQVCKCLFLHNLKLNSVNVASLARRIHSSSKRLSDSESKEQTVQKYETEELPQNTENSNFGRLHIPVMLEEVVNCLSPQPGQQFLDMTFGAGGHTAALLEKASDITVYALDRDPTAYKIAQQLSEAYPYYGLHALLHIGMPLGLLMPLLEKGYWTAGTFILVVFMLPIIFVNKTVDESKAASGMRLD